MHQFWVGCIGKCCHHSSELRGNTGLLRRFAREVSQYCPSIPENDVSIYRYILPRTNAFPHTYFVEVSLMLFRACAFGQKFNLCIFEVAFYYTNRSCLVIFVDHRISGSLSMVLQQYTTTQICREILGRPTRNTLQFLSRDIEKKVAASQYAHCTTQLVKNSHEKVSDCMLV